MGNDSAWSRFIDNLDEIFAIVGIITIVIVYITRVRMPPEANTVVSTIGGGLLGYIGGKRKTSGGINNGS